MKRKIFIWAQIIVAAALLGLLVGHTVENLPQKDEKAKYIFLFIGDGMGNSHAAATESYLSYKAGQRGAGKLSFTHFPFLGLCTTFSANRDITDSAASGTAIACGAKTKNGRIGVDKEGENLQSVAYALKDEGYKIGIMSSVPINHATPAAFYGHNLKRGNYYSISREIPASGFDFFGGAGFLDFNGKDGNEEDIDSYLKQNGYTVCYGIDEFNANAQNTDNIVFCQESKRKKSADNYVSDGKEIKDATLAEIVSLAINYLGDDKPFFIMCEGGAIDWSAQDNRIMSMVEEVIALDDAVKQAYEFYLAHPDETLIIVTADHETGGLSLGTKDGGSNIKWDELEKEWVESGKKNVLESKENLAFNKSCSIGWTSTGHTGAPVPVYAIGKGAEKFAGRLDNTEIKGKILAK